MNNTISLFAHYEQETAAVLPDSDGTCSEALECVEEPSYNYDEELDDAELAWDILMEELSIYCF